MNTPALILLSAAAAIGSIAFVVDVVIVRRYRALRTRRFVRRLEARVSELEAERDRLSAELDAAYLSGAELADRYWRAERCVRAALVRSLKRRAALVRIAQYCRETSDTWDVAVDYAGGVMAQLREQIDARDRAIDALTRRVAELIPASRIQEHVAVTQIRCDDRIAFVDGELDAARADAFRAHLRGCEACGRALPEDAQLAARLSTLEPAP